MGTLDFGGISPPRNQLATKTRFWVQRAPSHSLPGKLEVRSWNQKKEKSTLGLNISPHPQTTHFTYTFRFVRVGWGYRPNHPHQVSSHSVQQFRLPRGSKFTISHRLGEWLLQQCYALTCYTVIYRFIVKKMHQNSPNFYGNPKDVATPICETQISKTVATQTFDYMKNMDSLPANNEHSFW